MYNKNLILIIDSDENYAKGLAKYARDSGYFYDSAYSLNGKEGLDMLLLLKPDVVILDILIPVIDGIGFLRHLRDSDIDKKPVIIMNTYAKLSGMLSSAAEYGVDYFMIKPQSYENICAAAQDLLQGTQHVKETKDENNDLEKDITLFLRNLGMPAHLDGYKYMRSAILFTIDDPGVISPITKKLYPMIADKYNKNKSCIERALRHAINISWQRGNKKLLLDIFGYSRDSNLSRPTNSEYIAMAADDFRLKMKHNINFH